MLCLLDMYLKFIDLTKESNVIDSSVEATVSDDDYLMHIPIVKTTRHRVYAALCCYRFCESWAPIPYTVLKLKELNPQLHFWQLLHYAHKHCLKQQNQHSFLPIYKQKTSIAITLAAAAFVFNKKINSSIVNSRTCNAIDYYANLFSDKKVNILKCNKIFNIVCNEELGEQEKIKTITSWLS